MEAQRDYIDQVIDLLSRVPKDAIKHMGDLVLDAYNHEKSVFTMGNGGSASTASHLACDLQKNVCMWGEKKFRVLALTDNMAMMTALANDYDFSDVFAQQLANWVQPDDVVIAISGSGTSPNVVKAVEYADRAGAVTVALCGFDGGTLAKSARHAVIMPCSDMQHIEDAHMVISHLLMRYVTAALGARQMADMEDWMKPGGHSEEFAKPGSLVC